MQKIFLNEHQRAFVDNVLMHLSSNVTLSIGGTAKLCYSVTGSQKLCNQICTKYGNYVYYFENYGNQLMAANRWKFVAKVFDC